MANKILLVSKIAVKYQIVNNAYEKFCHNESMAYLLLCQSNRKTDTDI